MKTLHQKQRIGSTTKEEKPQDISFSPRVHILFLKCKQSSDPNLTNTMSFRDSLIAETKQNQQKEKERR